MPGLGRIKLKGKNTESGMGASTQREGKKAVQSIRLQSVKVAFCYPSPGVLRALTRGQGNKAGRQSDLRHQRKEVQWEVPLKMDQRNWPD